MIYFLIAAGLSFVLTLAVKKFAKKFQVVDVPNEPRKQHKKSVPLLGGVAIFVSFWAVVFYLYNYGGIIFRNLSARQLILFFLAGLILMVVGYFDDKFKIAYHYRLLFSAVAVLMVLAGGLNFDGITNPFGGTIGLDFWKIQTQAFGTILIGVEILAFLWLMGMIYTVKILDGLDGLATGVVMIGALSVAALAGGTTKFFQPDVALVAFTLAGSCLGFLFLNFSPAKIFLGEGGGQFLGLMLGTIAIIAGSKIATALLVMAVPIIDLVYVIIGRLKNHQSVSEGDRRHLHFRLVDSGFKQWQAVMIFYLFAALFGASALFMTSGWKLVTLLCLIFIVMILEAVVSKKQLYGKK